MVHYPIIINSTHLVSGTTNQFTYSFPTGAVQFKDSKVAVGTINLYYSWPNITSTLGNNSFQFVWPTSTGSTTYTVTITSGFYSIDTLNSYLQQFCVTNGLYLVNGSGDYIYYLEFLTNSTYYSIQFNSYPLPTSLPSGWTNPGSITFPAVATTPQLIVQSNGLRSIIGFNAGTYPSVAQSTNYSVLSTSTPQVTGVQSIILTCSLLQNKYSIPNTVLYSFGPGSTSYGSLIQANPPEFNFVDIYSGQYTQFTIAFLDQNFNALGMQDTNILVQLIIESP